MANKTKINKGKSIIAKFDGWVEFFPEKGQYSKKGVFNRRSTGQMHFDVDFLNYDTSWDWIMPVVEKIYMLPPVKTIHITPGETIIYFQRDEFKEAIKSPCLAENNSITECFIATVEFLEWYNENLIISTE